MPPTASARPRRWWAGRSGFLDAGEPHQCPVGGDDLSDIVFTSGTTGRPRGVPMAHAQNLRLYAEWCDVADLREGDRYLIVNPFFHISGFKADCLASLIRGATILPVAVFDVDRVLGLVQSERVTMLPGPPTLYQSLLAARTATTCPRCGPRSPGRPTSRSS